MPEHLPEHLPEPLPPHLPEQLPEHLPELLAPAGSPAAFLAALQGGADAIYLGVEDFNARRNAENFKLADLPGYCDLAHLIGVRVYLTLNTVILPEEVSAALKLAEGAWEAGVDALIVQDLGLLSTLSRQMPNLQLHASTQMNLHSTPAVEQAADFGASRVTLARELSLAEIAKIARTGVELEVFAHGALCICYSGQCLFSSLVGRRSANRGLCAQPCRLPYALIDTSTGKRAKAPGPHLLSPADLATIDLLEQLQAAGVAAIKIEGRMKSAAYVATVTRAYRQALDQLATNLGIGEARRQEQFIWRDTDSLDNPGIALAAGSDGGGQQPAEPDFSALAEVFSRGFSSAYLTGERGNAMMSYTRPNNRGVAVGRVAALQHGQVQVELSQPVEAGDVLEFWTSRGNVTASVTESATERLTLQVSQPVGLGDRVFRVRSAEVLASAEGLSVERLTQGNNGLVPVTARVVARLGEPLTVTFACAGDAAELSASDIGEPSAGGEAGFTAIGANVETARSRAIDETAIREHVGRVGGTPFYIVDWTIELDNNVGIPYSELHRLRSEALEKLRESLLNPWRTRLEHPVAARPAPPALAPATKGKPLIAALVAEASSLRAARQAGAELIYQTAPSPARKLWRTDADAIGTELTGLRQGTDALVRATAAPGTATSGTGASTANAHQ
ncbi:MAG: U32 family peptidase, partial [Coriobacteriales bacterium]|nr:U32 family peptidase [Coriobacteriales bacterium]